MATSRRRHPSRRAARPIPTGASVRRCVPVPRLEPPDRRRAAPPPASTRRRWPRRCFRWTCPRGRGSGRARPRVARVQRGGARRCRRGDDARRVPGRSSTPLRPDRRPPPATTGASLGRGCVEIIGRLPAGAPTSRPFCATASSLGDHRWRSCAVCIRTARSIAAAPGPPAAARRRRGPTPTSRAPPRRRRAGHSAGTGRPRRRCAGCRSARSATASRRSPSCWPAGTRSWAMAVRLELTGGALALHPPRAGVIA